jgi:putative hydrolase of the HAD superfamily
MKGLSVDWSAIKFVVFDVDGTLYDQRTIRKGMLIQLVTACLRDRSIKSLRVVAYYRSHREKLAAAEVEGFEGRLLTQTAAACGVSIDQVQAIVAEWLDRRPMTLLRKARYPHLEQVFAALHARGIVIGVLSDYPVTEKLAALELHVDLTAWAGEPDVNMLKPNPRGLIRLMERAGARPDQTLMIGDRDERDGEIARRCGVSVWLRSSRRLAGRNWFPTYDAKPFDTLLSDPRLPPPKS